VSTGHPSLCCPSAPLGVGHPHHRYSEGTGSMAGPVRTVIGGVDTHKDTHVVAALSEQGALLGTAAFPTSLVGYGQLLDWLQDFGAVRSIGIEGTGSYGAGLCRFLQAVGVLVREVSRPKRQWRRRYGKSDPRDAEAAARAMLAGEALGVPQQRNGTVEAIRMLRMARRSAIKARTQTTNQLRAVLDTAPDELREPLRGLSPQALVALARRWRPGAPTGPVAAARVTLKLLAERWAALSTELTQLDAHLRPLLATAAPRLLATHGVGPDTAAALLVAAGDNPERLATEASFAALCGVSPVDASSGRQHRHRLNRGGNREANRALWVIVLVRMATDPRTRQYVTRRTGQGLSKKEIIRCLKRHVAREMYRLLRLEATPLAGPLAA
jgi:transposase